MNKAGLDPGLPGDIQSGMDALSAFGLFTVTAMLVFYALEDRSPWYILAFEAACALASAYGFLQGAWPFGSSRPYSQALPSGDGKCGQGVLEGY